MSVLVLGDYRQTVTVTRSLARAGYRVTLGTDDPRSSTALSRCVSDVWLYEGACPHRFLDQLEERLRSKRPDYVFTVGETPLRRLIGAWSRFAPLSTWANPDPRTVVQCFDKRHMYALAARLAVPTAPWQAFNDPEGWRCTAREMGFPVVVKRKDSSAHVQSRKALILRDAPALDAFLLGVAQELDPQSLVLQKFAFGRRHNCHIAAAEGRLIAYFEQRVERTDEPDDTGIGVSGLSVAPSSVLRDYCERLARALSYTGIGCVQFIVDRRKGTAAFLEFNARMDSTAALPYQLGYDFPLLAVRLADFASGQAPCPQPVHRPYRLGKAYHWLYGDLSAWLAYARHGSESRAQLAAWGARMLWDAASSYHLTWELRDPLPTLHAYWKKFASAPRERMVAGSKVRQAAK